jgi:predicted O-methyltransferase YrrM
MSTVWFSIHAGEVCSVEDYRQWHDKVTGIFSQKGINNVIYKFAETASDYYTFMSDDAKGFDLIMVDGNWRSKCIMNAAKLLKPGGILYLDNSDKDSSPQGGDMRLAEQLAREFAQSKCAKITEFTDFAPTQLFVQQGIMIRT